MGRSCCELCRGGRKLRDSGCKRAHVVAGNGFRLLVIRRMHLLGMLVVKGEFGDFRYVENVARLHRNSYAQRGNGKLPCCVQG